MLSNYHFVYRALPLDNNLVILIIDRVALPKSHSPANPNKASIPQNVCYIKHSRVLYHAHLYSIVEIDSHVEGIKLIVWKISQQAKILEGLIKKYQRLASTGSASRRGQASSRLKFYQRKLRHLYDAVKKQYHAYYPP